MFDFVVFVVWFVCWLFCYLLAMCFLGSAKGLLLTMVGATFWRLLMCALRYVFVCLCSMFVWYTCFCLIVFSPLCCFASVAA